MGQKMEESSGLTPQQKQLLDLALRESYFLETFYLSGGTALSSWYLHHRESEDLDFFSLTPFDYDKITRWFRENQQDIGYTYSHFDEDYGFLTVNLHYPNNKFLKIDFNHYSRKKLSPGIRWKGLEIDSLRDIAVNKLYTVATQPRTRDYIDLFAILKSVSWSLDNLISDTTKKFREKVDKLQLAKNFLKVSEYTDFPKMLVPIDNNAMEKFYEDLAKQLKSKILK
ncbi:MAG: nucleotidyl transferase AbiEii/AbiGii toxin family protein [Patescibacteria group bacterium]